MLSEESQSNSNNILTCVQQSHQVFTLGSGKSLFDGYEGIYG